MKKLSELLFVISVSLGVSTVASYLKLWRKIWKNNFYPYAWWEVNLGQKYYIDEIDIWNRTDSDCADRLFPFTLSVLENDRDVAWSSSIIISQVNPLLFSRPDVVGQFVFN